jgi:hypothetical protein
MGGDGGGREGAVGATREAGLCTEGGGMARRTAERETVREQRRTNGMTQHLLRKGGVLEARWGGVVGTSLAAGKAGLDTTRGGSAKREEEEGGSTKREQEEKESNPSPPPLAAETSPQ